MGMKNENEETTQPRDERDHTQDDGTQSQNS